MARGLCAVLLLLLSVGACRRLDVGSPTSVPATAAANETVVVADGEATAPAATAEPPGSSTPTAADKLTPSEAPVDCGELTVEGQPPAITSDRTLAQGSLACFEQAYRDCKPATLSVRDPDNSALRQFAVIGGSACGLREAFQTDPSAPPAIADCSGLRAQDGGLTIRGCSHLGDFTIPRPD